jgi:hypothetical protein
MKERLAMSNKERDRLVAIKEVLGGKKKWREAQEELSVSIRQIGYMCARVRAEGDRGIIHGLCGQPSNRRIDPGVVERAIKKVREEYGDFGPTLANEKLAKAGIKISTSRLRKAMIAANIWDAGREKKRHRAWRERRSRVGMMALVDGSDHEWFEGRGPRCVLLLFIDDATSRLMHMEFVESEDTKNLMQSTRGYIEKYGRPVSMYVDRDSIYKTNRQATVEESLRDVMPDTQFTRAMGELNVGMIFALSPQAKGRVERAFETLQDRMVKEMRLAGVRTMAEGNAFMSEVYMPEHNTKFAVEPAEPGNGHRALLKRHNLNQIMSIRTSRVVCNDWTVRFNNKFFQLLAGQPVRIRARKMVEMEERLDGSLHIRCKESYLNYKQLPERPYKAYYANGIRNRASTPKPGSLAYASQVSITI